MFVSTIVFVQNSELIPISIWYSFIRLSRSDTRIEYLPLNWVNILLVEIDDHVELMKSTMYPPSASSSIYGPNLFIASRAFKLCVPELLASFGFNAGSINGTRLDFENDGQVGRFFHF